MAEMSVDECMKQVKAMRSGDSSGSTLGEYVRQSRESGSSQIDTDEGTKCERFAVTFAYASFAIAIYIMCIGRVEGAITLVGIAFALSAAAIGRIATEGWHGFPFVMSLINIGLLIFDIVHHRLILY